MPARTFYTSQILANCAVLFPGKSPHLITVNDSGKRQIFIISSITGELLLVHAGTDSPDILRLLTHTENLLSSHVPAIRRGNGPVIGDSKVDWKGQLKEVQVSQESDSQSEEFSEERLKEHDADVARILKKLEDSKFTACAVTEAKRKGLACIKKANDDFLKRGRKTYEESEKLLLEDLEKKTAEIEKLRQEAAQMKEKSAAEVADLKKEIESLKAQAEREVMGWKRENDTLRGEVEYHRESAKMNMGRPGQAGWGRTPATSVFGD